MQRQMINEKLKRDRERRMKKKSIAQEILSRRMSSEMKRPCTIRTIKLMLLKKNLCVIFNIVNLRAFVYVIAKQTQQDHMTCKQIA